MTVSVRVQDFLLRWTEGSRRGTVKVKLSEDPEESVTIPLSTVNQGGASDSDYSLAFPLSVDVRQLARRTKTFSVTAVEDYLEDSGESVKLSFGTLPDRVSAGTTDEATVSIINKQCAELPDRRLRLFSARVV